MSDSMYCECADMTVVVDGVPLTKIRDIRYKDSKEKQLLHAAGDERYEGHIRVLKGALEDMNRAAQAAGGHDILDMQFDIVVSYKARGARMLQTDTLVGVEVKDFEVGWDQGAKNMDITLPIVFLKLLAA